MLSDILKAVSMLIDCIQKFAGSDTKARRIAKLLHRLYLLLDDLVGQADLVLQCSKTKKSMKVHQLIAAAQRHYDLSREIAKILTDKKLTNIARVFVPEVKPLLMLVWWRISEVNLLLSQLVGQEEPKKLIPYDSGHGSGTYNKNELRTVDQFWDEILKGDWRFYDTGAIVASDSDATALEQVIREIANVRDKLRGFIVEHYEIRDIL